MQFSSPILVPTLVVVFLAASLGGAQEETAGDASFDLPETVRFNRDIRTIFSKTCFECHGPDANTREAKLRFDVRDVATRKRKKGTPIVPGDAANSLAYQLITTDDLDDQMPPEDFHTVLTDREKALIKKWIDQGAEYETHWSFIPPVKAKLPTVKHADAVRNPIDSFVIAKLESNGLSPAPMADRRTLVRRVTLDLTGLPPTPAEVRAFVEDPASDDDAYAKVVDRLLASPRFGEQRARYWLDAARYADTSGYQYDKERTQWVWRDWVINAFNTNMPFDQFTIEQNAGDLIPNATDQTRLATGFHRNHPITIEGGVIDEEYRTEYVMDRVVTTSTAWMGLTYLCSRCHDHKYDPISQDDFYSFYAFFNNVPEKGLNGFEPTMPISSPLGEGQSQALADDLNSKEKTFDQALAKVSASISGWELELKKSVPSIPAALKTDAVTATGGTKLETQPDGSVLASGPNPVTQTYQIDFTLGTEATSAIQLEALTHDSLPNKSTGRASNGNFVLSEFKVETAPAGAPDAALKPVKISKASADHEQAGYPVAAAIDGNEAKTGWAVNGNTRTANSSAVFTFAEPIAAGSRLRVRLIHNFGGSHAIGRFRLSTPGGSTIPNNIAGILAIEASKRGAADQKVLATFLAIRFGPPSFAAADRDLAALRQQLTQAAAKAPKTMIMAELPKPRETHVLIRGEYDKADKERPVTPNVLTALGGLPDDLPRNRLGLAQWLVSPNNPLTARVTANRFWSQIFGTGIVKTVEDFGSQGEYPTHPELLDWLAVGFMESGWDVKALIRTFVTSGTYRQSSHITPEIHTRDPYNRLLARGPGFRLDAEAIRDSALFASGLLDESIGGPSVYPYHPEGLWLEINNRPGFSGPYPHSKAPADLYRRSMYTFWKRTVAPPSMATFDAPEREYCVVQRSRTNTPLQALALLHDRQFIEAARKLAERMIHEAPADAAARITHGFELCTSRAPTPRELSLLQKALGENLERYTADPDAAAKLIAVGESPRDPKIEAPELAAYAELARLMLNLSEFITKD